MSKVELARSSFSEDLDCAQALLSTYGPEFGLDSETAIKVTAVFSGGIGRMGETCGAVTGAFMVIGLQHGRTAADDTESKQKTVEVVREFTRQFLARNDTLVCRELLGCDISTDEGFLFAHENNRIDTLCPRYITDAA